MVASNNFWAHLALENVLLRLCGWPAAVLLGHAELGTECLRWQ